ncbi:hypothetical protein SDC9_156950 [bioreactor metagenome]|uniref:Uncharacterized protein n=1 Tax=bioreactor metagenome TaxID=1076179 RepID=A0A645F8J9_9ZZZZ
MVVSLVFEHQEPVLNLAVHRGGNVDGTGVDLLALVKVLQNAPLFQRLCPDGGYVHQRLGAEFCLFRTVDLFPGGEIPDISRFHPWVQNLHLVDVGGEGGVAAVV